jgi:DNA-binding IclR family transcriptional regulator
LVTHKETAEDKDRQYVTALARGLQILRCFTAATPTLGTSEIARMTGLAQPTVWRLCHTLIQEGYLVQTDRKDKLRPGIPVLGLGFSAISSTPVAELARSQMQSLADRHQGAVSLGVRDGSAMVYLQRCQGSQIVLRDMSVGSRVPILSSVTGWAWLTALSTTERATALTELQREEPALYEAMYPKFTEALERYALTGYLVNKGSLHPQINAVGVPITSSDGKTQMALSSGGISQLFDDDKLKQVGAELRVLAQEVAIALSAQSR